jgi:enoyl-[acyl-carrier protein] reductase II
MSLVPQIVDAVKIPAIAAGGIADARGLVAALALGAVGIQVGTRFVASTECIAHQNYKEAVLKAKERSTTVSGVSTGHPVRVIANKLTREYEEMERHGASTEELEQLGAGKLRMAVREGNVEYGSVMIGQIAGMITNIKSVEEIIQDFVQGVPEVLNGITEAE